MKKERKVLYIEIDGKEYPCYQTMGALMLLEQQTGKNASECTTMSDQVVFLWACCKSACRREKVEFPYSVEDFADNITPEDLASWVVAQEREDEREERGEADGSKKA